MAWKFTPGGEHVDLGNLPAPAEIRNHDPVKSDAGSGIDLDAPLIDDFFKHMLPDITGHGARADKYLSKAMPGGAPYNGTYRARKIKVECEGPDPDAKIKLVYQLLIAGATEGVSGQTGYANMWKKGTVEGGRKVYPDFGRYMNLQEFQTIASTLPYLFAEEKHWYLKQGTVPWEVFMPILDSHSEKRRHFLKVFFLMLDESMSGWRPKTSKLGGLPNYTYVRTAVLPPHCSPYCPYCPPHCRTARRTAHAALPAVLPAVLPSVLPAVLPYSPPSTLPTPCCPRRRTAVLLAVLTLRRPHAAGTNPANPCRSAPC